MAGQWVNVPGKGMRYLKDGRFTLAGEGEVKDTSSALGMLFSNPRAYFGLKSAPAAASPRRYSGAGEFYSDPNSSLPRGARSASPQGPPVPARLNVAPPAPPELPTTPRTANPASNPPRVTPRAEVQSQALGTAIQQAQGPSFWESNTAMKEAADNGPRAGTAGYANRADIQAWMKANPALAQAFLEKERKAGRLNEGNAGLTADQALLQAQGAGALDDFKGGTTDDALLFAQQEGFNPAAPASPTRAALLSTDDYLRGAQAAGALDGFRGGSADDAILAAMGQGYGAAELTPAAQTAFDPNEVLNQVGAQRELPTWQSSLELAQPVVPKGQAMAAAQQPALEAQMDFTDTSAYANSLLQEHLRKARLGL